MLGLTLAKRNMSGKLRHEVKQMGLSVCFLEITISCHSHCLPFLTLGGSEERKLGWGVLIRQKRWLKFT